MALLAARQHEQRLAEQLRLSNSITDNATTALFILDERQQCVFMNPAAEQLTGLTFAEVRRRGGALRDIVHPTRSDGSAHPLSEYPLDQVFPTRNQKKGEEVFVHKDGHFYPVEFSASPLRNEKGQARGTVIEVQDITARKQAEQELRESQRLLRAMLAQFPAAVGVMDRSGVWTLTNSLMDQYVPEAIPVTPSGRKPRWRAWDERGRLLPPEDWPGQQALRGEVVVPGLVMLHVTDEGQERWMRVGSAPLRDDQGAIVGATCVVQDIDEAKRAQDALRENEERLRLAMDAANAGSWKVNPRTGEFIASERALALHGLPPGTHMTHQRALDCVHPDDRAAVEKAIHRAVEAGEPLRLEHRVPRPDGSIGWVAAQAEARNENGQTWIVGLVQDITERKQTEEELARAVARADVAQLAARATCYEFRPATGEVIRNATLEEVLGYLPEELDATPGGWRALIHPEEVAAFDAAVADAMLHGVPIALEYRVRHKAGHWVWMSDQASVFRDPDGNIGRIVGLVKDVTESKRTEEALRDALADAQLLHRLTVEMAQPGTPQTLYECLMDAAVEIMHSDFASLQMLYPGRGQPGGKGELRLLAHRGFPPEAGRHWEWVRADSACACGIALQESQRCDIPDIVCDERITGADRDVYVQTGIRAVQTTPLIARDGHILGAISTHWKTPRDPHMLTERDWRMLDVLTQHAADLLERVKT
ncbi:MAG: PAS domain S-box protein, partial [Pirellulaceae bacterium]